MRNLIAIFPKPVEQLEIPTKLKFVKGDIAETKVLDITQSVLHILYGIQKCVEAMLKNWWPWIVRFWSFTFNCYLIKVNLVYW